MLDFIDDAEDIELLAPPDDQEDDVALVEPVDGASSFSLPSLGRPWDLPAWMTQALCVETDPEAFFPAKGGSTREAKTVCRRCPVSFECLEYALANEDRYGIWGGMSERERRKLYRKGSIA